jgi:hypothetical protein
MQRPDFDFRIGKHRCLKGQGWKGLVALGLFLGFWLATVALASSSAQVGIAWLLR